MKDEDMWFLFLAEKEKEIRTLNINNSAFVHFTILWMIELSNGLYDLIGFNKLLWAT